MKQGGVLVPRKYHLIRTAYEINEEPTAYGDHGIRIYGIWSPIAEGKICTHAVKWKMVRKAVDVQEAAADGALAPLGLVAITVPLLKICTNKGKTNQLMGIPERISPAWMTRNCTITCTV